MAPEMGVNVVALYLEFVNGELIAHGERLDTPRDITWYSLAQPENSYAVLGGVAYMYDASTDKSKEIRNARLGTGTRYYWKDNAQGDGLMFILVLPENYTVSRPEPIIKEAKIFSRRLAIYWFLRSGDTRQVSVQWSLKEIVGDLESEIARITSIISSSEGYEIALSFAGEDRDYVEQVADILSAEGVRVFYDRYETVSLWGKDLYSHLDQVYRKRAKYTIVFISEHYAKKLWTTHERKSAQARAFTESQEYILPVRFDDTEVPGILPTTAYVSLKNTSPKQLADMILQKIWPL